MSLSDEPLFVPEFVDAPEFVVELVALGSSAFPLEPLALGLTVPLLLEPLVPVPLFAPEPMEPLPEVPPVAEPAPPEA